MSPYYSNSNFSVAWRLRCLSKTSTHTSVRQPDGKCHYFICCQVQRVGASSQLQQYGLFSRAPYMHFKLQTRAIAQQYAVFYPSRNGGSIILFLPKMEKKTKIRQYGEFSVSVKATHLKK